MQIWQVDPCDNVATALTDIAGGESLRPGLDAVQAIPRGHKIALSDVASGEAIKKYGFPIGRATCDIPKGAHVHIHNLATALRGTRDYRYVRPPAKAGKTGLDASFLGYRRADGRVATRNEIWILPTVGCVARTAERIAARSARDHEGAVDGIYAFQHPFGCSQLGEDLAGTRAILASLANHPNAAGVLIVGLGCESNQMRTMLAELPPERHSLIRTLVAQETVDEVAEGCALVAELIEQARAVREACAFGELVLGVKCGGSDGLSGLTANPLVGRITDLVTGAGGQAILTEIPEIFGAEQVLMDRAADAHVFERLTRLINEFKNYFLSHGEPISENPSPGNIAGGITTLEEKSLGAVQKGGRAIVTDVIGYAGRATERGLTLLEAPGNDAVSATALTAAGATVILFTTGRGTPLGFPVPTIKIATNSALATAKPGWIDFDAGAVLGRGMAGAEVDLLARICAIASGEQTAAESNGEREIAIWKRGVTL